MTTTRTQTHERDAAAETIRFGVEFEVLLPRRCDIPRGSYSRPKRLDDHGFPPGWKSKSDSSVDTNQRGWRGYEFVSPPLRGRDGLAQIEQVCKRLREAGARVNATCGFHVHVEATSGCGADDFRTVAAWVRRLVLHAANHELAFYGASGSRRRLRSRYCRSIKHPDAWAQYKDSVLAKKNPTYDEINNVGRWIGRYHSLNVRALVSHGTVEFRCFSGTVNARKAKAWVQMALALAMLARKRPTDFDAKPVTYADITTASGALQRFFYLAGWVRGRKDYRKPACVAAGWIEDIDEIKNAKRELRRLAQKFDGA